MANKTKVKSETKQVLLSELIEHSDNPNVHPEAQIKAIAESIEKYGQYYPIICDDKLNILCGHGKKKALEYKGEQYAEVRIIYNLTEKQKKKLLIEDNKIQSLSYTNYDKVEDIIRDIGDTDIIGFPEEFLNTIINDISVDNMGVDFSEKPKVEKIFTPEKQEQQTESVQQFEEDMVRANTITCPHCNNEITL
ncbi:ParB N-terminal domain-containing protein [Riemerella columbina]|uniref:ParB N-terminal domain-containing protein n=1 Tax=Riemerella columbina TaxID=103810 RepID=UPI0003A69D42|nr:ParB N-terminal domain-containing protein [Riemerella columbina]